MFRHTLLAVFVLLPTLASAESIPATKPVKVPTAAATKPATAQQPAAAQPALSGSEVLARANRATPRDYADGIAWEVVVEEWEGSTQKNTQHVKLQTKGDNTMAEFIAPAKVSGRRLLMKDKSMWFFKPGLLKPVPISPRQRLLSAASYGDLVSINYSADYTIAKQGEEVLDGDPCYVFELQAKAKDETYARLKHWVSKARQVGVRTEYYTQAGTMLKWATFDFTNTLQVGGQAIPFLSRSVIHDPNVKDSVAVLKFGRVRVETVPDSAFDLNLVVR